MTDIVERLPVMSSPRCRDCSMNTTALGNNYYVVHDDIWSASGLGGNDGMLCIACLERRLGRPLALADFKLTNPGNRDFWGGDRMLPGCWEKP